MTNTTQSHWQDQISLLPTRPERATNFERAENTSKLLDFNFELWRRPEKNEIPRQVLRAEVVQQFQVLIESMGSFRPHREERVVADEHISAGRLESAALNLFRQGS